MKRIYRWLGIITLSCLIACTTFFIANVPEPSQIVSANDIHGITRPMAERWAWWHFYTSNNGALPNGSEKIPINNQNFRVVSWWTRDHKRIVVKIMRKNPGLRDIEYRVYRVSTAGNLKLRNDAQTYSSGTTVWDIVSHQYHSLENMKWGNIMKFCKYCGAQLENNSQFCPNCGRKVGHQPSPKLKRPLMTKQRKLLTGIGILIIVFALAGFGWWKYQHPSLQKAVTGSIYQYNVTGNIDGEKETGKGYFIFSRDGRYYQTASKKDVNKFETSSFNKAAHTTNDDDERYDYYINNNSKKIKLHSYIRDTSKNSHGEFIVSQFDRSNILASFKGSPTWEMDDQSDYNLQFKLTKIGEVK